jgi:uncharacterized membrane protein
MTMDLVVFAIVVVGAALIALGLAIDRRRTTHEGLALALIGLLLILLDAALALAAPSSASSSRSSEEHHVRP